MRAEIDGHMGIVKKAEMKKKLEQIKEKEKKEKKKKKKTRQVHHHLRVIHPKLKLILPLSLSLKKTQRNQKGNNPPERPKSKAQSKKRKQVVEDSSPEQTQSYDGSKLGTEVLEEFLRESKKKKTNEKAAAQGKKGAPLPSTEGHYDSSETIPDVNLGSENDPLSQGQTDQISINKPADSMLSLVEESANDPAEQNMIVVRVETQSQTEALLIVLIQVYVPLSQTTPWPEIKPSPAKSPREKISEERTKSTPQPPKPDENNPAPEDTAALMMMARTASYIPKEDLMPSFSFGLTDSSQEEAPTEEGQRAKSPETPKLIEQLEELVEKITSSGVKTALDYAESKSPPIENNEMSAEMKEKYYVWVTRVKTYGDGNTNEYDLVCTLKAQDRFILSKIHFASLKATTHIEAENMAIVNHSDGKFLQPKTKKPFRVEDYPMFIPFLDLKKLASHPYGYVISRMRVYAGEYLSEKWIRKLNRHTLTSQAKKKLENIKRGKYEWDNWTQEEVDHFKVEFASRILFHEMNQDRAEAIRRSDAIRLSKPSSLLLSPYCQIDSYDIDTD
ncbi:uncharacterized protein DS421_12g358220 [Arachis hypogaea]|nr:uncharacterized protein DS421_12g358220 [Arachis hypogaea]